MGALLVLAARILGISGNILTVVNALRSAVAGNTQEHAAYTIEENVIETNNALEIGPNRLSVLDGKLDAVSTLATNIGTKVDEIYTIVGALGGPITLPDPAPTGYGGASTDDITDAVWNAENTRSWGSNTFGDEWSHFTNVTFNEAKYTLRTPWENADWWVYGPWDVPMSDIPSDAPAVLLTNALSTDALVDFLTREAPTFTWNDDGTFGPYVYALSQSNSQFIYVYKVSNGMWPILLSQLFPAAAVGSGWPGIANVVLSAPTALDVTWRCDGPMDGVLIAISDAPTKQGFFTFDTVKSWRNIGALAFGDDWAGEELPQTLGFDQAVYTPRAIAQPLFVVGRCAAGVSGTVTPWTRVV